jgi:hypothetical protein
LGNAATVPGLKNLDMRIALNVELVLVEANVADKQKGYPLVSAYPAGRARQSSDGRIAKYALKSLPMNE